MTSSNTGAKPEEFQEETTTNQEPEQEGEERMATNQDDAVSPPTAPAAATSSSSRVRRLESSKSEGMEASVLKFHNVNFLVRSTATKTDNSNEKNDDDEKIKEEGETTTATTSQPQRFQNILTNVSGVVKYGRVLAILGPSGAGKTTLMNALALEASYGVATGSVTLNGQPMTSKIFQEHCFLVPQQDNHWPYLTCRETLMFATQLYQIVESHDEAALVEEILEKMGLQQCADTVNARLSGGQRRRLSIGLALVKQPRVLFLDEPTTGLDAASAENIMQEIVRVARDEKLITLCTIHQPSTKVYNQFDQVLILSRGRTAFTGNVKEAIPYFEQDLGHAMPEDTNPAEFFLDLVNSDFTDDAEVEHILDMWQEKNPGGGAGGSTHNSASRHGQDPDGNANDEEDGVVNLSRRRMLPQIKVLFRRQFLMIIRDPILYVGRCVMFLMANMVFALVFLSARGNGQDEVWNKFWIVLWYSCVPTQFGVVAVYALNEEFKSLLRETKNGMLSGASYVLAKSCLTLPIMYIFSLFALGIPFYAVTAAPRESFAWCTLLYAVAYFHYESFAELLSVWFEDPILGMLQYMNFWFGGFLFGGFLIPLRDMYWPFTLFYYLMPFSYYMRSTMYNYFKDSEFDDCNPDLVQDQAVCVPAPEGSTTVPGLLVLQEFTNIFPLLKTEDETVQDIVIILFVGLFYKIVYTVGVLMKTSHVSKFESK